MKHVFNNSAGRQRQADLSSSHPVLHSNSQANRGHTVRACLKNQRKQKPRKGNMPHCCLEVISGLEASAGEEEGRV